MRYAKYSSIKHPPEISQSSILKQDLMPMTWGYPYCLIDKVIPLSTSRESPWHKTSNSTEQSFKGGLICVTVMTMSMSSINHMF